MTKETKVGLLVGLAFIILFAIILSEKGATNNVSGTSQLTVADAGQSGDALVPRTATPLAGDGKMPIENALPPATETRTVRRSDPVIPERPVGIPIPKSQDDIQPLPAAVVHQLNYTPMAERPIELDDVGKKPSTPSRLSNKVVKALTGHDATAPRLVVGTDSEDSMDRDEAPRSSRPKSRPVEIKPVRIIANHKVESGESLGKIAAKYYGRSTPSRVNAIFDVNRDKLTSIHAVRIGDVLRIPAIPDADGMSFANATEFRGAAVDSAVHHRSDEVRIPLPINADHDSGASSESKGDSPAPIEFKWYEVHENDTLSGIAQRQMGSAKLYLKLYDLNRDLLPNKNSIKPGMKIRIPVTRADEQFSSAHYSRSRRDGGQ